MIHHHIAATCLALVLTATCGAAEVTKLAVDFSAGDWSPSPWNKAPATVAADDDAAPDGRGGSTRVEVAFPGNGDFQWCSVHPPAPLVIPGKAQVIELWVAGGEGYPITVGFKDGWGRDKVGKDKLEWGIRRDDAGWQQVRFEVPQSWVMPIEITGITTHNYSSKGSAATPVFRYDDLVVTTDTSGVDPATGLLADWQPNPDQPDAAQPAARLFTAAIGSDAPQHIFAGSAPRFTVNATSWLPGALEGELSWRVLGWDGTELSTGSSALSVIDIASTAFEPEVPGFGQYELVAAARFADGTAVEESVRFAALPVPEPLSAAEKDASPYGLNVHGGRHVLPDAFAAAGITWYRDYAFAFDWTQKSKGADHSFTGWPNHRAIADAYIERDLRYLACMPKAIPRPEKGQVPGSMPGPDRAWSDHLIDVLKAFPGIAHWELDNEYELHGESKAYEQAVDWDHYRAYHKRFAEVVELVTAGEAVAVENGRAGIWPQLAAACVDSGDFAQIGVVNIHHYCGHDAPELNVSNHNTNFGDAFSNRQEPMLFLDRMRETAAAADRDGTDREVWLTEFGWDEQAGPKVPVLEKSAYLQRGYLVCLQAGIDKAFWFFDLQGDPATADNFFDGCGLLDMHQQPLLSLASYAGLTKMLPAPEYVGSVRLGDGVLGHVLRSRGQLVAALFTVSRADAASYTFDADAVYDFVGNPIDGQQVELGITPTWAIGIGADDPLYAQTAYELDSRGFVQAAAGDRFEAVVAITNNREAALSASIEVELPAGWTVDGRPAPVALEPGESASVRLPITIAADQAVGEEQVRIRVREADAVVKELPVRVLAVTPIAMQLAAIEGEPGNTTLAVKVLNQSAGPVDVDLALALPAAWSSSAAEQRLAGLAPGEIREVELPLTWGIEVGADERALLSASVAGYAPVVQPVIPPQRSLPQLSEIVLDGDLSEWPTASRLPDWMLGVRGLSADAALYAGWHADGVYLAVDVQGSTMHVTNPKTFWEGDVLELFIGTSGEHAKRSWRPDDHQFWILPLEAEDRIYLGRWKRAESIPATIYDIPGMQGKAVRTETGYRMELLVPASAITGWDPKPGARLGVVLSLTAVGEQGRREIYWPMSKQSAAPWQPGTWGTWWLAE